jgi:TATA-box binding protein (TBP) (component of TFIID and TFIIIB)
MDPKKISTKTIMVYFNFNFRIEFIAQNRDQFINCANVVAPLTKKNKQIDKKKIKAPYGDIFSSKYKDSIVGLNTYKKTKTTSRITYFLNQIMFSVSLGQINVNVMMFKDKFKISGCKTDNHAIETVKEFWNQLQKLNTETDKFFELKSFETPFFILETVMMNTGFNLNMYIERNKLNKIMNKPEYKDKVLLSQYESTTHSNVNIKMFSHIPENYTYTKVSLTDSKFTLHESQIDINIFKKKKEKQHKDTFIVFSSGQVIITGRYLSNMLENCKFFMDIVKNELVDN